MWCVAELNEPLSVGNEQAKLPQYWSYQKLLIFSPIDW